MIPREPTRGPTPGFLYVPPFRIQGISIAGEQTVVQVPELDICFDIGLCPRHALTSNFVALSHGHMDHVAALTYYFSQRNFLGMGEGTLVCPQALQQPIEQVMEAWVHLEAQRTPYRIIPLAPDEQITLRNNTLLRGFATDHTVPSLGYVVLEQRSKLKPEYVGLTQPQLVALKQQGETITAPLEIPQVCYTGDTAWGEHFERPDVLGARVLITECTFVEADQHDRAAVGKHLHLGHILELLERSSAEAVVLTHLSRRSHMGMVHRMIEEAIPEKHRERLLILMDHRGNRQRYEAQVAAAAAKETDDDA